MTELQFKIAEDVPMAVVRTIAADVMPRVVKWINQERLDLADDIKGMSCQPHENFIDWVLKVHLSNGGMRVFPISMRWIN